MDIFAAIAILVALSAGLLVPFAMFSGYRFVRARSEAFPIAALVWLIGIGSILIIAASGRNLNSLDLYADAGISSTGSWISRLFSLAAVSLSIVEIIRQGLAVPHWHKHGGFSLWLAFLLIFASWLISAVGGTKPGFQHAAIYSVAVLSAAFLQPVIDVRQVVRQAKHVVAVMLWSSLIVAMFRPDMAVEHGYHGLIPGLNFRLHGLTTHANSLGPLAVLYLLLEFWLPSRNSWRVANVTIALIALSLAQSKTAWISAFVAALVLHSFHAPRTDEQSIRSVPYKLVVSLAFLVLLASGALLWGVLGNFAPQLPRDFQDRLSGLSTLTGRDIVWDVTLKEWQANPIFGYGPSLWNLEYRIAHGLLMAGQAHNQFIQTLGDSGLIGITALLGYLIVMMYYAAKHAKASNGVTLALFSILFTRCFTESPFRLSVFLEPAFLTHLIVFTSLVTMERSARTNLSPQQEHDKHMPA